MKTIASVSGGYDPLHSGHIALFKKAARESSDGKIVVLLNDDEWLAKKKGKPFMPFAERKIIIENLSMVKEVIEVVSDGSGTACKALEALRDDNPSDIIIFCNGGDRHSSNIPEMAVEDIHHIYGCGGTQKLNSSSWILKEAVALESEERQWGKFYNFFLDKEIKVKEIIVDAHKSLSYQRHQHRAEFWFVSKGFGKVVYEGGYKILSKFSQYHVDKKAWHQLVNLSDDPLHVIEIQYGSETSEEDIERKL